jgi:propionyl-CoA carboxylase alpha chain
MRNKSFRDGIYGTNFIPEEYPEGFKGVSLESKELYELIASAAGMHIAKCDLRSGEEDQYESEEETKEFVIVVGGVEGDAYSVKIEKIFGNGSLRVMIAPLNSNEDGTIVDINTMDWTPGNSIARVAFAHKHADDRANFSESLNKYAWDGDFYEDDGSVELIQVQDRTTEGYKLRYKGSEHEVLIRTIRENALSVHMLPPEKKDYSNMLLCPMPGTLVSIDVEEGDTVVDGQPVAVVEAMKMQNILRAEKNGVVKFVHCKAGATLKTDQVIVEYE